MASAFPSFPHARQGSSQPSQIPAAHAPAEPKRGLLARVLDALIESRQREAEERLARLLVQSGANSPTAPRSGKPSALFSGADLLTSPRNTQRGWSQGHLRGQRRVS